MRSTVAVVRCGSYEPEEVRAAVRRGLSLLGGPQRFASPAETILLKPNVLFGDPPPRCTATHPAVLAAVGEAFGGVAGRLTYGDSPGFGRPAGAMRRSGLAEAAERLGIGLADFESGVEVPFPQSPFQRSFLIARGVREADGIVSLPKLKTHGITRLTGAVKNQLGCVPGMRKAEWHLKLPGHEDFARMLVALNLLLRPRLYVMDGVMAMEGNGPRGGDPFPLGVLLLSADPVALDATACRLVDLDPRRVPTSEPGRGWGLGTWREEEIELLGDPPGPLVRRDFKVERRAPLGPNPMQKLALFRNAVSPRPVIDARLCTACGLCVQVCPARPKALSFPRRRGRGARCSPTGAASAATAARRCARSGPSASGPRRSGGCCGSSGRRAAAAARRGSRSTPAPRRRAAPPVPGTPTAPPRRTSPPAGRSACPCRCPRRRQTGRGDGEPGADPEGGRGVGLGRHPLPAAEDLVEAPPGQEMAHHVAGELVGLVGQDGQPHAAAGQLVEQPGHLGVGMGAAGPAPGVLGLGAGHALADAGGVPLAGGSERPASTEKPWPMKYL